MEGLHQSGAPITNEMVAGKLDFGSMADFPGSLNGAAFQKAGKKSIFITVLSGSTDGSGNGIVVPADSPVQSLADLKGKTISVPFASTRTACCCARSRRKGWDPGARREHPHAGARSGRPRACRRARSTRTPTSCRSPTCSRTAALRARSTTARRRNAPTFHGTLVDADYAKKYPEIVVAYLRAVIEANRLFAPTRRSTAN